MTTVLTKGGSTRALLAGSGYHRDASPAGAPFRAVSPIAGTPAAGASATALTDASGAPLLEPVVYHATRRPLDPTEYKLRGALESDYETLIDRPTIVYDDAERAVKIVYLELVDDCSAVMAALNRIKYLENARTSGLKTRSKVFGYQPRVAIRQDYCTVARLAQEDAAAHALITSYAQRVAVYYQRYNPELYARHQQLLTKVLPDWQLEDSVFTSGIINNNNPLLYHFDAGNFKDVWSNMLVFKDRIAGGYLSVPEYGVGFALRHNSLLMFDGQNILHGVTPITLLAPDAHRYSIVYYSLRGLWNCLTPGEEVARIQRKRTEREFKRAANPLLDPNVYKKNRRRTSGDGDAESETGGATGSERAS